MGGWVGRGRIRCRLVRDFSRKESSYRPRHSALSILFKTYPHCFIFSSLEVERASGEELHVLAPLYIIFSCMERKSSREA